MTYRRRLIHRDDLDDINESLANRDVNDVRSASASDFLGFMFAIPGSAFCWYLDWNEGILGCLALAVIFFIGGKLSSVHLNDPKNLK